MAPLGEGLLRPPPLNKNGNFFTFFGAIEPQKFDFSYKPIIAFRGLEMAKKGVSIVSFQIWDRNISDAPRIKELDEKVVFNH